MGGGAYLQLDSTPATSAPDPAADAPAQRDRRLDNDAENRVGALPATGAVKSRSTDKRIYMAIDAETPIG